MLYSVADGEPGEGEGRTGAGGDRRGASRAGGYVPGVVEAVAEGALSGADGYALPDEWGGVYRIVRQAGDGG